MKVLILFLFGLMITSARAQTAMVIQLREADAREAKQLVLEQKTLDARKEAFKDKITKDYLLSDMTETPWVNGFEYDETYRFIVPAPFKPSVYYSTPLGCTYLTSPAHGAL